MTEYHTIVLPNRGPTTHLNFGIRYVTAFGKGSHPTPAQVEYARRFKEEFLYAAGPAILARMQLATFWPVEALPGDPVLKVTTVELTFGAGTRTRHLVGPKEPELWARYFVQRVHNRLNGLKAPMVPSSLAQTLKPLKPLSAGYDPKP